MLREGECTHLEACVQQPGELVALVGLANLLKRISRGVPKSRGVVQGHKQLAAKRASGNNAT